MSVGNRSRALAVLSYLVPVVVPLFVLLFRRGDQFAAFHARQSLVFVAGLILAPAVWYAIAWLVMWIPQVGGPLGFALFSAVLAVYLALIYGWVRGLVDSVQSEQRPMPLVGGWSRYLP